MCAAERAYVRHAAVIDANAMAYDPTPLPRHKSAYRATTTGYESLALEARARPCTSGERIAAIRSSASTTPHDCFARAVAASPGRLHTRMLIASAVGLGPGLGDKRDPNRRRPDDRIRDRLALNRTSAPPRLRAPGRRPVVLA